MFTPVGPRASAVDACADALQRAILNGSLPAGARLPPERRLAEDFGVNRVTVRSALARLAASGLVAARQGSGTVVEDFRRRGGPDLLPGLLELAGDSADVTSLVAELLRVRRHLAQALLERLAEHGEAVDLAPVEAAVEAFAAAVEAGGDLDTLTARDLDVLAALLDASVSPVLRLCFNPVQRVVYSLPTLRAAMYADPQSNVAGYGLLMGWLRASSDRPVADVTALLAARDARTLATLRGAANER